MASIHEKLERVRRPRVHIKYEVETEGAQVEKELPFVVGVLGDFSGHPSEPLKPLKDRKFVQIDRDNFDEVLARMTPGLMFRVANTLRDDGSEIAGGRAVPVHGRLRAGAGGRSDPGPAQPAGEAQPAA